MQSNTAGNINNNDQNNVSPIWTRVLKGRKAALPMEQLAN